MTAIVETGRAGFHEQQHRIRVENFLRVSRESLGLADPAGDHVRAELPARFGGRRCRAWIDVLEDADAVLFTVDAPFTVHPDRFEQACLILNPLGGETVWGCFRLDAGERVSCEAAAGLFLDDGKEIQ